MPISKSEYMMSLRHPAWLWLKKHRPSMLPKPGSALQARFDEGHAFEDHALELFGGVMRLGFTDYDSYLSLPGRTQQVLEQGAEVIAQGRFEAGDLTCVVDVLKRNADGSFDLIEIKSSTREKEDHFFDLAFQRAVLEEAGVPLRQILIFHVDKSYRRSGAIEPNRLVKQVDVTEEVDDKADVTQRAISRAREIVQTAQMPDPSPEHARLGAYQDWLEIYELLNGPIPDNSIYRLPYIKADTITELLTNGVRTIDQIEDVSVLSPSQLRYVEAMRLGSRHVDADGIAAFLSNISYPLYFLDYETSFSLIPPFDGIGPYQQVPFQYSLHVQQEPGGEIQHLEYLHEEPSFPVPTLLEKLNQDVGPEGSILVWYAPFETGRNKEMAELVPDQAPFLDRLNSRVKDLMDPFRDGLIVDPGFKGSASIKNVLPILVPDLAYGDLDIQEGETASRLWKEATLDGRHIERRQEIYADLRDYCRLDTWAMVRIFQVLQSL